MDVNSKQLEHIYWSHRAAYISGLRIEEAGQGDPGEAAVAAAQLLPTLRKWTLGSVTPCVRGSGWGTSRRPSENNTCCFTSIFCTLRQSFWWLTLTRNDAEKEILGKCSCSWAKLKEYTTTTTGNNESAKLPIPCTLSYLRRCYTEQSLSN